MNRMMSFVSAFAVGVMVTAAAHAQNQFFTSDGVKIRYVVEGEGEPLVLIHGFSASVETNWRLPGIFNTLVQDYKVIALDNRGHGQSDKPHDPAQYGPQMARDVVNLLDYLEIPKAHVAGYSLGGFITLHLLAHYPERVHSAIIAGAGWNDGSGQTGPTEDFAETLATSLEEGRGITPLIEALTPEGQPMPSEEQMRATNTMLMASNDPLALAAVIRGMRALNVTEEQLQVNEVPVVCVVGEIDPLRAAADAMTGITGAFDGVVLVPGGDHLTALGNPVLAGAMKEFLKKHPMGKSAAETAVPSGS